jgi:iron(III) transport system substrate-binding protein
VGNGAESNPALPPLATLEAPAVYPSSHNSQKVTDLMTAARLI